MRSRAFPPPPPCFRLRWWRPTCAGRAKDSGADKDALSGYSCRPWMRTKKKKTGGRWILRTGSAEGPAVITVTTAPRCLCLRARTRDHIACPLSREEGRRIYEKARGRVVRRAVGRLCLCRSPAVAEVLRLQRNYCWFVTLSFVHACCVQWVGGQW